MKNFSVLLIAACATFALSLLPKTSAIAQSPPEPTVVVSMAPLQEQMDDIKNLVKASGYGNMNFLIQSQIKHFTSGLDRNRASGVLLFFEGDNPQPKWLGMAALENQEDFLDRMSDIADVEEGDDYITVTPDNGQAMLAKSVDGYLFIADNADMFAMIPSDPEAVLADLGTDFNLAVKLYGQRVPAELRQLAVDKLDDAYQSQLDQEGMSAEELEKAEAALDNSREQLNSLINETDEIMMGMKADKESGLLSMEVVIKGLEGSRLAEQCNLMMDMPDTKFAGFINPEAAVNGNMRMKISESDMETYKNLLDSIDGQIVEEIDEDGEMSDEELAQVERIVQNVKEVLNETISMGVLDAGGVLMMDRGKMEFAFGGLVADPAKLEISIKELLQIAQDKADGKIDVKLNSGVYEGINLHTVDVIVDDDEEEIQSIFGQKMTVLIGIGTDAVYVCGGKNPLATLTNAIEKSKNGAAQPTDLNQYNVYLAPILRFASGVAKQPGIERMAAELEEKGTDQIRAVSNVIENGISSKFTMQEGILSLIKVGVEAAQQGGFDGGFDEF